MSFEINHDWQANLATPRIKVGEHAKNYLLILLCAIWIFAGLWGHEPWKFDEINSINIVQHMVDDGRLIAPTLTAQAQIYNPPLYYLSAALFAKLSAPLLNLHDGARLVNAFWMGLTLLLIGMIGREFWGVGRGRQTAFLLLGSVGLLVSAHLLIPEIAALTGATMAFYGLALSLRKPLRAGLLLGLGISISFLTTGLLVALISLASGLVLVLAFKAWRQKNVRDAYGIALILASSLIGSWVWLCWRAEPLLLHEWWQFSLAQLGFAHHRYFVGVLTWAAWPALPIALWGLWLYRRQLLLEPKFQLILTFFIVGLLITGAYHYKREIFIFPLFIPVVALAGGCVDSLKRGVSGLLDWFGILLFGLIGLFLWLGWSALVLGWPEKLAVRMRFLSGLESAPIRWVYLIFALLMSAAWLVSVFRAKRSNRVAVTDWALGITMTWALLMFLWLPFIDAAKSYKGIIQEISSALPAQYRCINGYRLSQSQLLFLDYYQHLPIKMVAQPRQFNCDIALIQIKRDEAPLTMGDAWKLLWQGERKTDRSEHFLLYQRVEN